MFTRLFRSVGKRRFRGVNKRRFSSYQYDNDEVNDVIWGAKIGVVCGGIGGFAKGVVDTYRQNKVLFGIDPYWTTNSLPTNVILSTTLCWSYTMFFGASGCLVGAIVGATWPLTSLCLAGACICTIAKDSTRK